MTCDKSSLFSVLVFIQKSGNAVLGIPYVLASISFCQLFNLDLLKASASLTLAELWLSLGSTHAKRAVTLIHGALPIILGHGGLELRGRAFIAEAKCYLSDSSFSGVYLRVLENSGNTLAKLYAFSVDVESTIYSFCELSIQSLTILKLYWIH